ncbi:MAG: class I SAM-dependent methyltransferase [Puniceicoccales bacterium]|jgi:23S rRNA (cytosine1962-C5)-methyltransferase|nr:class I SAM-dependent methyltransferase [Puniceicoccales bacterium]
MQTTDTSSDTATAATATTADTAAATTTVAAKPSNMSITATITATSPSPASTTSLIPTTSSTPLATAPAATTVAPSIEILETHWDSYRLLDSGNRRKLEQFGTVRLIRSEPKAWWRPALPVAEWDKAVAVHEDDAREGRWRFTANAPRQWELPFDAAGHRLRLQLRFTDSSKQIGVFPEQSPHWRHLAALRSNAPQIPSAPSAPESPTAPAPPLRVLNLFGYTGAATLVCAAAGCRVTHVDASKPAVTWARANQELSGLADAPVRWFVEDAVKFVRREVKRGSRYDVVLLDPPAFGRGPDGELWKIERDLPPLLDDCRAILSERASLVLLTVYTIDASSILCRNLLAQMTHGLGGKITSGELTHRDEAGGRLLPLSLWGRWEA